ncbi:hypothetical protein M8C21_025018, partial [Ambrosia artemisiifolia]
TPSLSSKLGNEVNNLKIKEVGDGNLNFVYIVTSPSGSIVIKQSDEEFSQISCAIPYVRCIGESWPMTKERSYFEATALKRQHGLSPKHVPEVYHFDRTMSVIGMRYIEPPHIILRKGLIAGVEYPLLAEHMSDFMANTLFYTSLLYLTTTQHKSAVAEFCANVELCRLTEQVVFSDPYKVSEYNHWTTPYLDSDAEAVRNDKVLKLEVAELKSKFLIYGHATQENDRKAYKAWIIDTIADTWNLFYKKFTSLWDIHKEGPGEAYLHEIYNDVELWENVKQKYMIDLFHDSLGFGAAKMIRRIVGVAHVEDFESITDSVKRADCERKALDFAKNLMKKRRSFNTITDVISTAQ